MMQKAYKRYIKALSRPTVQQQLLSKEEGLSLNIKLTHTPSHTIKVKQFVVPQLQSNVI